MLLCPRGLCWPLLLLTCGSLLILTGRNTISEHLCALTLSDVSEFLRTYEAKIACLRAGICEVSISSYLRTGVLWNPAELDIYNGAKLAESVAAAESPLWLEALCLFLGFCVLTFSCLVIGCIVWVRYVKLLLEAWALLLRAARHVDWRSPLHVLQALYTSSRHAARTSAYVWSRIPSRERYLLTCMVAFVGCVLAARVGFGRRRFWCLLPLAVTSGLYYSMATFLKPATHLVTARYVGLYIPLLWMLSILLRHYWVRCRPSLRLVEKSTDSPLAVHELDYLLDLFLVIGLLHVCEATPLIGSLLLRRFYVHHIVCFFSMMTLLQCALVQRFDRGLRSSPLRRVKRLIIASIDASVHFLVGWPNIVSSRVSSPPTACRFPDNLYRSMGSVLTFFVPSPSGRFAHLVGLASALRWLKLAPHLLVLLLPSFVSRLYFAYLTLVSPSVTCVLLPRGSSFRSQTVVGLNFVLADAVRSLVSLAAVPFLPLRAFACLALPACMDVVRQCVEDPPSESAHARSD